MIRFAVFLALFCLLIGVCIYYKERFNSKLYIAMIVLFSALFIGGFIYTSLDNSSGARKQELLNIYKSGKTLQCSGVPVNKNTHSFNNGTSVFIDLATNKKLEILHCTPQD